MRKKEKTCKNTKTWINIAWILFTLKVVSLLWYKRKKIPINFLSGDRQNNCFPLDWEHGFSHNMTPILFLFLCFFFECLRPSKFHSSLMQQYWHVFNFYSLDRIETFVSYSSEVIYFISSRKSSAKLMHLYLPFFVTPCSGSNECIYLFYCNICYMFFIYVSIEYLRCLNEFISSFFSVYSVLVYQEIN